METDHEALRHVLRASPSVLARALGDPATFRVSADSEPSQSVTLRTGERIPEPSFEVFNEGNEILIVSELPGIQAEQIRIYGYATQVVVHVREGGGRYSVRLPLRIEPTSICYDFRNNILTIRAHPSGMSATA